MTEDLNRGVSEDTSAEVEGAEGASSTGEMSTGASFTGTEGSQQLIGQASVVVARPGAGQTVQISAELGQTYVIDFDPAAAQVSVEGDNLVMTFADGGRIVIQGLGSLTTEPGAPTFSIAGTEIEAGTLFGQAIALSGGEADPEAAATLEVAAGTETIPSGGVGLDDSGPGDSLDLLNAQGVIAPVERDFGLIDLEVIAGTVTVTVDDDSPVAANDVDTAEVLLEVDSNIVIVFDRSGSMTVDPNVAGFSQRIDLARAAIASLLAGADSIGTANVLIIDFATAANSSGWMTVDEANAYLSALVAGGRTNYEVAADAVQAAFPIGLPGGAEQNLLYWLSDGNPTTGDFTGSEVSDWETFLTANDMQAIAVGIGSGATESGLDPVAFPNDDPDNPIILTDEIDLLSTLIVPLPVAASGNVLDNDEFGADGEDTPAVVQFVHDSILYTPATPVGGTVISNAGGVIVIVTALGAEFEFDFNTGAYTYAGSTDGGGSETFEYIIQDGDGDRSTAVLTIDVPPTPDLEGLPLIAGDDGGIVDDTLDGTDEAEILAGGGGDDTLNGGGGNDLLFGGDGDDTLNGGPGDDNLLGGPGDDSIFSSLGSDTINVGADNSGGGARPDLSSSQDTVFYTNVLHAGDVIDNFDAAGSSHDVIDLDGLFDNLGVADADRAARVSIVDSDTDQQQVLIDTNGDSTFDLTLVTVNLISGDLNDWLDTGEIVVF